MNSVATNKSYVATKVERNYKTNVATQKSMSRHNEEINGEISVTTMIKQWQQSFVSIIKFMSR